MSHRSSARRAARALGPLALAVLASCEAAVAELPAPVADAGPDRVEAFAPVEGEHRAGLAGSGTGELAGWTWRIAAAPAGARARLEAADGRRASLLASAPGRYVIALVVTDAAGTASAPDYATIALVGGAPAPAALEVHPGYAVGGATRPAAPGERVALSARVTGVGPDDGPASAFSFTWAQVGGPAGAIALEPGAADAASFVAALPEGEDAATYELEATVRTASRAAAGRVSVAVTRVAVRARLTCLVGGAPCEAGHPEGATASLAVVLEEPAGAAHETAWALALLSGDADLGTATLVPAGDAATLVLPETDGDATLRVRATLDVEGAGALELGAEVLVRDTTDRPPVVEVAPPAAGQRLVGDVVTITATAVDPEGLAPVCTWTVTGVAPAAVRPSSQSCSRWEGRILAGGRATFRLVASDGVGSGEGETFVDVRGPRRLGTTLATVGDVAIAPSGNVYGAGAELHDPSAWLASANVSGQIAGNGVLAPGGPVLATPAGEVWLGPGSGGGRVVVALEDPPADETPPFFGAAELREEAVGAQPRSLGVDAAGGVVAGGDAGLLVYFRPDGTRRDREVTDADGSPRIRAVLGLGAGEVLLGTRVGLVHFAGIGGADGVTGALAWDGGGDPVERLVAAEPGKAWAITFDELDDVRALFRLDLADPTAAVVLEGPLEAPPVTASDPTPVRPAAEPAGTYAGELWLPRGEAGLRRVLPDGTALDLVVPLTNPDNGNAAIVWHAAAFASRQGRRTVVFGTSEGFFVID